MSQTSYVTIQMTNGRIVITILPIDLDQVRGSLEDETQNNGLHACLMHQGRQPCGRCVVYAADCQGEVMEASLKERQTP